MSDAPKPKEVHAVKDVDPGQNRVVLEKTCVDPLQNQLCRVCQEPAAGYHFGAFTCEGCKSFFGRTCNNQSIIHDCKNNYKCVVDKKNRTACKACRLRKCLLVGMSKSGSRYGRRSNWFKIHCLMQQQHEGRESPSKPVEPKSINKSSSAMVQAPMAPTTESERGPSPDDLVPSDPFLGLQVQSPLVLSTLLAHYRPWPLLNWSQLASNPLLIPGKSGSPAHLSSLSSHSSESHNEPIDLTKSSVAMDANDNVIGTQDESMGGTILDLTVSKISPPT